MIDPVIVAVGGYLMNQYGCYETRAYVIMPRASLEACVIHFRSVISFHKH